MAKHYIKKIAQPGTFQVFDPVSKKPKRVTLSRKRIDHWNQTFQDLTAKGWKIPGPYKHDPNALPTKEEQLASNNAGFWDKMWVRGDGELWARLTVENEDDIKKIGKNVKEVSLYAPREWLDPDGEEGATIQDPIVHIALVTDPVIKGQENFEEVPGDVDPATVTPKSMTDRPMSEESTHAIALSMSDYLAFAQDPAKSDPEGQNASGSTVKDVIALLKKCKPPIVMPADTNADNFLERMAAVLVAIQAVTEEDEDTSINDPDPKGKSPPGPIAMAKETDNLIGIILSSGQLNPKTRKPWTKGELETAMKAEPAPEPVALSMSQMAHISAAQKIVARDYANRLTACVKEGKITPATAAEFKKDFLDVDGGLELSIDPAGNILPTAADKVLAAYEKLPKFSCPAPSRAPGQRPQRTTEVHDEGGIAFSVDMDNIPEVPDDNQTRPADEIVNDVFKMMGIDAREPAPTR